MAHRMKCLAVLLSLALSSSALAQSVQQSGNVTPGHVPMWTTTGVIQDAGVATNGFLTSLGVVASGPGICQNSGPITGAFNQICLTASDTGGGFTFTSFGGATGVPTFTVNGTSYNFPFFTDFFDARAYGVKCDGTTNDVAAFNAAISTVHNAGGGTVQIPPGVCIIGGAEVDFQDNTYLRGAGQNATILRIGSAWVGSAVVSFFRNNVGLYDLTVDGQDFGAGSGNNNYKEGLFQGSTNFTINNVGFIRIGTFGLTVLQSSHCTVSNNYFTITSPMVVSQTGLLFAGSAPINHDCFISNNYGNGAPFEIDGQQLVVTKNTITGWNGGGSGIVMGPGSTSFSNVVTSNVVYNGLTGSLDCYEFWEPYSVFANNIGHDCQEHGVTIGGINSVISGNVMYDNSQASAGTYVGFECNFSSNNSTSNCGGSIISGNRAFNTAGASGPQKYGFSQVGTTPNVILGINDFADNRLGSIDPGIIAISQTYGHFHIPQLKVPTVSACGSGTVDSGSSDNAGSVTATGASSCTVQFGSLWSVAPNCTVTDYTTANGLKALKPNTSGFNVSGLTSGDQFGWVCVGN